MHQSRSWVFGFCGSVASFEFARDQGVDVGRLDQPAIRADLPEGVEEGNWIQADPSKGWFVALRLYSPLDKSWRPSEIALVE